MASYLVANLYDFLLYPFLHSTRKKTAKLITQLNPESVLDVCCGTGNQLTYIKSTSINLTGIDLSENMMKKSDRVKCYVQDARKIEFPNESYDLALIQLALHEKPLEDQIKIIGEMHRVIKPNGYLLIIDYQISKKTNKSSKYIIHTIEFLAGRNHYKNFRQFHRNNCTQKLIDESDFYLEKHELLAGKAISLKLFRKR